MSITTTARTLCPGDVIRFSKTGRELTVQTTALHPDLDGLITLTLGSVPAPVNLTSDTTVTALVMKRTTSVRCYLCMEDYAHEYDMATGATGVLGGICGPCDQRATISVLRSMGEVPPRA